MTGTAWARWRRIGAVDIAAVLGTIFGVATSLGIGVVFLNVGLNVLFDVGVGTGVQVALAVLAVTVAAVSATTGVDKGIRFLSQLNVILALGLAGSGDPRLPRPVRAAPGVPAHA